MTQLIRVMTLAVLSTVFFGVLSTVALGADKSAASSQATRGDNDSLTDQMQQLSGGSSSEKFYVVHDRRSGNAGVFDISAGAGYNTNSDVNIRSSEQMARINYHATDKVFLSVAGSQVHNQFNLSAQKRMEEDGTFPNVGFVKSRVDLSIGYNLIYGKARVSKDAIFYFDQYVAIGGGVINQTNTREEVKTPAAVVDIGASFWFGRTVSLALGAKTYRFKETRLASEGVANHVVAYANLGMLLGGAG